jgi:hypothetical protein
MGRANGHAQRLGCFGRAQAGEEAQADQGGGVRVNGLQLLQGVAEGKDVFNGWGGATRTASWNSSRRAWPPRLTAWRRRACSTRMRRMASAAAAKKGPRPFQCGALAVFTRRS